MAVHDGLTDVFNRGYLELAIDRAVKDVERRGGRVSVLFVDVDGMKDVNDTCGHQAGDMLLVELAGCSRRAAARRMWWRGTAVTSSSSSWARRTPPARTRWHARWRPRSRRATPPRGAASLASIGTHTAGAGAADTLLREADRKMYAVKRTRASRSGGPGGSASAGSSRSLLLRVRPGTASPGTTSREGGRTCRVQPAHGAGLLRLDRR